MTQNAKNFISKVMSDPALKAKVLNLYKKNQTTEIEKIAKEVGTPCTFKEIESEFKSEKLSDTDLLKIAGGQVKFPQAPPPP